jgi:hypothetical protein
MEMCKQDQKEADAAGHNNSSLRPKARKLVIDECLFHSQEKILGSHAQGHGLNLTGRKALVRFGDGYHYFVHYYEFLIIH